MPLDFDKDAVRFARLSMPTKIPEYMAAGRAVLTYAPRGCAAAEYARDGGWSLLVDRPDPASLREALSSLVGRPEGRVVMGATGRELAVQRHEASKVRAVFAAELSRAAIGPDPAAGRAAR
jgi:glycosyltransferase involved in cell wall biosynthesis